MRRALTYHESNARFDKPDYEAQIAHCISTGRWGKYGCIGLAVHVSQTGAPRAGAYGDLLYEVGVETDADYHRMVHAHTLAYDAVAAGNDPEKHRANRQRWIDQGARYLTIAGLPTDASNAIILDYDLIKSFRYVKQF